MSQADETPPTAADRFRSAIRTVRRSSSTLRALSASSTSLRVRSSPNPTTTSASTASTASTASAAGNNATSTRSHRLQRRLSLLPHSSEIPIKKDDDNDNNDTEPQDNESFEQVQRYDDTTDEEAKDLPSQTRVAAFSLINGICRSSLDIIGSMPSTTLNRLGLLTTWSVNAQGTFIFDDSFRKWDWAVVRDEIGIKGLYKGLQWTLLDGISKSCIRWLVNWIPRSIGFKLTPFARQFITSVLSAVPQMYCQWRYISDTCTCTDTTSTTSATSIGTSLSDMFLIVPWWLIISKVTSDYWNDNNSSMEFMNSIFTIKYLVPMNHPLRETRTLTECIQKTSGFWCFFSIAALVFQPIPDYDLYTGFWSEGIKPVLLSSIWSYCFGAAVVRPFRYVYSKLINNILEDKEHRLARKLQHSADKKTFGFVSVFGDDDDDDEEEDNEKEATQKKSTSRLLRQSTIVLKKKAVAKNFAMKQSELYKRQFEHSKICLEKYVSNGQTTQHFNADRSHMEASVDALAHAEILPLKLGHVTVAYKSEQGLDAGGLFRDWIETIANELSLKENKEKENDTNVDDQDKKDEDEMDRLIQNANGIYPLCKLLEQGPDAGLLPTSCPIEQKYQMTWRIQMFGIGRLMGLALTSGTPLPLTMSRTMYKVILGEAITSYDVKRIDPTFYKSRVATIMEKDGVKKMEAILYDELYFVGMPTNEEEAEEGTGEPLMKGGATIRVTETNKKKYVRLLIEHYLIGRAREGVSLIVEGFKDVVPKSVLRSNSDASTKISALDLELMITGLPEIDVEDWQNNTVGNINHEENALIKQWFWEAVEKMDVEHRAKLLSYTCGSSRLPASGFAGLTRPFSVSISGESIDNLPSAHTCFNMLQIPRYEGPEILQEKLKRAIEECEGFGFI